MSRLLLLIFVAGCTTACSGPPALEVDLQLSDAVLAAAHSARLVMTPTDDVTFPPADPVTLAPGLTVRNLDADGDGKVDVVVDMDPTWAFGRDNRFRLEPVAFTRSFNVSVRAEVFDGLGNRFARLGGATRVPTDERVNAVLAPGQVTKLGSLAPTCVATCPTSTWSIAVGDADQTLSGVDEVTALAVIPGATLSSLVVGSAHQGAKVTGGIQWANNGAVRVWYGAAQLNATADVTIVGSFGGEQLGAAVAVLDADKDGMQDLLLGAPGADGGKGAIWLLYGGTWPAEIDLGAIPTTVRVTKISGLVDGERFGSSIGIVSETSSQIAERVIVGAPGSDHIYRIQPGVTDVANATKLQGAAGSSFGSTLATSGALLAISAPLDAASPGFGLVVVADLSNPLPADPSGLPHARGEGGGFGSALALATLAGDTSPSLVVGAPAGNIVMVFPSAQMLAGTAMTATRTIRAEAGSTLGSSLSTVHRDVGDLLIVGAPGRAGSFFFAGASQPDSTTNDVAVDDTGRPADIAVTAGTAAPSFGTRAVVTSLTSTLTPDLIVGSNGAVYLFKGPIL